ncbi:MAG: CcdB family protein [Pseudomonadota bacterium]
MARFDIYVNPAKAARHVLYVDVQSDFVDLGTRWCLPLLRHFSGWPMIQGVQARVVVDSIEFLMDTPSVLAVPLVILRKRAGRLSASEQLDAESCIDFMLRGY